MADKRKGIRVPVFLEPMFKSLHQQLGVVKKSLSDTFSPKSVAGFEKAATTALVDPLAKMNANLAAAEKNFKKLQTHYDKHGNKNASGGLTGADKTKFSEANDEYQLARTEITLAGEAQENLTRATLEWADAAELAESKFARASGVRRPSLAAGREALRKREDPLSQASNQFTFAAGRVVQDSPFGLLGMANNFPELLRTAGKVKAADGSILGALGQGMKGPFGAILGMNIVTSLMIGWPKLVKGVGWLKEQFGGMRDLTKEIRKNMIESAAGQFKFSSGVAQATKEYEGAQAALAGLRAEEKRMRADRQAASGSAAGAAGVKTQGAFGDQSGNNPLALTPEQVRENAEQEKVIKDQIEAQVKVVEKAAQNVGKERGIILAAQLAEDQELVDRFNRERLGEVKKSVADEIKARDNLGLESVELARTQADIETRIRIASLDEQSAAARENFEASKNERYASLAESLDAEARLLDANRNEIDRRAEFNARKAGVAFRQRLEDIQRDAASILASSRIQTFSTRRQEAGVSRDDALLDIEREIAGEIDLTKRAALRASYAAQIVAIEREAAFSVREIARDEARFRIDQARSVEDMRTEISGKALEHYKGKATDRLRMEDAHANRILDLQRQADDERLKVGDEFNQDMIDQIENLSEAEQGAHDLRMENFDEEVAAQRELAVMALQAKSDQLSAASELIAFERSRQRGPGSMFGFNRDPAGGLGSQLSGQQFGQDQAVAALEGQYERDRAARMAKKIGADTPLQAQIDADELLHEQNHQQALTNILEQGENARAAISASFAQEQNQYRRQMITDTLGAFAGMMRSQVTIWETGRRTQLANEGKTQQQINAIVTAEGKKRFGFYKALAVAEAVISTHFSAQLAYEKGMKYGGPVMASAAAAVAYLSGMARVQKIRAQTIGGSGGGGGAGGGGSAIQGAIATASGGSPSSRLANVPGASLIPGGQSTAFVLQAINTALEKVGTRPIENVVVIESETQGRIVQQGQNINDRRSR